MARLATDHDQAFRAALRDAGAEGAPEDVRLAFMAGIEFGSSVPAEVSPVDGMPPGGEEAFARFCAGAPGRELHYPLLQFFWKGACHGMAKRAGLEQLLRQPAGEAEMSIA